MTHFFDPLNNPFWPKPRHLKAIPGRAKMTKNWSFLIKKFDHLTMTWQPARTAASAACAGRILTFARITRWFLAIWWKSPKMRFLRNHENFFRDFREKVKNDTLCPFFTFFKRPKFDKNVDLAELSEPTKETAKVAILVILSKIAKMRNLPDTWRPRDFCVLRKNRPISRKKILLWKFSEFSENFSRKILKFSENFAGHQSRQNRPQVYHLGTPGSLLAPCPAQER